MALQICDKAEEAEVRVSKFLERRHGRIYDRGLIKRSDFKQEIIYSGHDSH